MTYEELVQQFLAVYPGSDQEIRVFEAPGRVNLIGEHIDYNGGNVLPAALTLSNVAVVRPNGQDVIRLAVTSLPDRVTAKIDSLEDYRDLKWGNYQLGSAYELQQNGQEIIGCDILYHGTVPYGGGLSSSASIEVATVLAFAGLAGHSLSVEELSLLAQKAENEYVGMNCGIMDQFASAAGKRDHAILLNCETLAYELLPLQLGENELVLIDSKKPHSLVDSKYNERRAECDSAYEALKKRFPDIPNLCAVTPKQLEENKDLMPSETVYRRAHHAITEQARTLRAAECLQRGELEEFGELVKQSHESLRDDYESTGEELDTIYEIGKDLPGVLGIRATGAGFGGSAVAIVNKADVPAFEKAMKTAYCAKIGYDCDVFHCGIGDGGREIDWKNKRNVEQGQG